MNKLKNIELAQDETISEILTAIIVDDEIEAINYLQALLEIHPRIKILGNYTNPIEAIEQILLLKPDILFLDVQMPNKTGFDIVKEIRSENYQPHIVFTTAYEQFAIRAIKHAAFDYLLKPINEYELSETLEKIRNIGKAELNESKFEKLFNKLASAEKLKFNTSTGFIIINSDDIIYCEADRNYCEIHLLDDRREVVTCNLNQVGKILPESDFFRISRFNIINLNFLEKVERKNHSCYLKTNDEKYTLKISSSNLKLLEDYFSNI
ncbi:MAG: LytTR family DNA-binding domain-containing protein [Bacteroidales bacterium]|jgi:two-component system LytT family response regulator|nr:LytTR family DNA-binding domain-containing protein [Bacteroidales bacterium]